MNTWYPLLRFTVTIWHLRAVVAIVLIAAASASAQQPAFSSGDDAYVAMSTYNRASGAHRDNPTPVTIEARSREQRHRTDNPDVEFAWVTRSEASVYKYTNPTRSHGQNHVSR